MNNEMEKMNSELVLKEKLECLVNSFGEGQEGVKAALRECQSINGCVSISHQHMIADIFGVSPKVVKTLIKITPGISESVVEYEVVCCSGPRCANNGSVEVIKAVKDTLGIDFGETTSDGRIRLSSQNCFHQCKKGPNMMINGVFHHGMNKEKAQKVCSDMIKK